MRFNVDRVCELAGLGAASGGLISEAAEPVAPVKKPAPVAPAVKAPVAPAAKTAPPAMEAYEEEGDEEEGYSMDEYDEAYDLASMGNDIEDEEIYEIDENDLMEALVSMRQQRLEESAVRDAVRDEIKRALSDKSGSWVYGSNKPTASRHGQIARGGFGIGFGFKR